MCAVPVCRAWSSFLFSASPLLLTRHRNVFFANILLFGVSSTRARSFPAPPFRPFAFALRGAFRPRSMYWGKSSATRDRIAWILRWFPTLAPSRVHLHDAPKEKSVSTIHGAVMTVRRVRALFTCLHAYNSCEIVRLVLRIFDGPKKRSIVRTFPFSLLEKAGTLPTARDSDFVGVEPTPEELQSQSGASRGILRWRRSRRANRPRLTYTSLCNCKCAMTMHSKAYEPIPPEYTSLSPRWWKTPSKPSWRGRNAGKRFIFSRTTSASPVRWRRQN